MHTGFLSPFPLPPLHFHAHPRFPVQWLNNKRTCLNSPSFIAPSPMPWPLAEFSVLSPGLINTSTVPYSWPKERLFSLFPFEIAFDYHENREVVVKEMLSSPALTPSFPLKFSCHPKTRDFRLQGHTMLALYAPNPTLLPCARMMVLDPPEVLIAISVVPFTADFLIWFCSWYIPCMFVHTCVIGFRLALRKQRFLPVWDHRLREGERGRYGWDGTYEKRKISDWNNKLRKADKWG